MKLFFALMLAGLVSVLSGAGLDIENGEFVLGFYSADPATEENFQLIRDTGMNYVHTYGTGGDSEKTLENSRRFLDLAEKYNLKVLFDIGGRNWVGPTPDSEGLMKMINEFKNHPALGMWYLYDEPSIQLLPKLQELRQAIRQAAPDIPSTLVIHWIKDWYKIRVACDVMMVDLYPVRDQKFPDSKLSNYNSYVNRALHLTNPSKPVIGVMQSMSWECFAHQLKKGPEAQFRFPNDVEMRNMAFSSIAMGVRGLFFYSFFHVHTKPSHMAYHPVKKTNMDWYKGTFMPFIKEVKEFAALVHPSWNVTAQSDPLNKEHDVYLGYWVRPAGKYLVLTNNSKENRDLTLDLKQNPKLPVRGKLTPWGGTRSGAGTLKNGILSVNKAAPWESFVWKLD